MTTDTTISRKRRALRGAAVAITATAALAGSGTAAAARPVADPVMRDVARSVLSLGVSGYVARVDDGRRTTATAAGVADRRTGRPLTSRDQFEIGSNTKTFTAVLVLQLVDQGQLELDAPIERYLPGVVPGGRHITVRMLLNHTSGLFNYTEDPGFVSGIRQDPQHVYTDEDLLGVAFRHEPVFAPGNDWSYSNTNYIVLGVLLREVSGKGFPELVRRRIAEPLGLTRTYVADPRATHTGRGYAHGYLMTYAGGAPGYTDVSTWPLGGFAGAAGAIISTPGELSHFFSSLLRGDLLSARQLKQMKTTVDLPTGFGQNGYGLGLWRLESPCGIVWGHGGDTLGHHSVAVVSADGRRSAVTDVTANLGDAEPNEGQARFARVVTAADTVAICRMLGKPVPADVLAALHS